MSQQCGKRAHVTLLFKKGEKSNPSNYRPVSLTSIVCKGMGKIVRSSVVEHLVRNNLILNVRFRFRNGRSYMLQLLNVLEDWSTYFEKNMS